MGANAQTSVPSFADGQVLTGQQQTEINTGIPVFATSVERDAAFGGTGEKVLAEGQFAFLEDSNTTQFYDGSTWQAVGVSPGLVLVKSQVVGSAVSSVEVTGAFSATYDNYKISYSGGSGSSVSGISMVLGATATGYYNSLIYTTHGSATVSVTTATNAVNWITAGSQNSIPMLNLEIQNPFLSVKTLANSSRSDGETGGLIGFWGGYLNNTTSYTAFTIEPVAGTFTGGTIRVYGYANS
jgi:hypothetical protein